VDTTVVEADIDYPTDADLPEGAVRELGGLVRRVKARGAASRTRFRRLVSLADPDARPIRKGKPGRPTEFGYTLLLAEEERGFVCDHQLQRGNPPGASQLVPAVQRVIGVSGWPQGTVVGDRGFGTAANDQAMEALGVKRVGLQPTGTRVRRGWGWSGPGGSGGCATGGS
jgi:hypothetical protein